MYYVSIFIAADTSRTVFLPQREKGHRCPGEGDRTKDLVYGWTSTPQRARLVSKTGQTLLTNVELPERFRAKYKNWFHLIIECNWRTIIVVLITGFLGSWTFFGMLYYVVTVVGFETVSASLMESQHTIGYGFRYMTESCPPAYVILSIQLIVGVFLQTMLTGIVLAKVLRPKKRKQEMRFSRMAVVGPLDEHDRRPALMIRLADIQEKLFLAESHVRLYMASSRINSRGDRELIGVKDINVGYDSGWDRVLLLWPIIVRHVIDESSPLHGLTKESLLVKFELIMTVEGIVEATGMTFQARTSFLPNEILWGHKFKPMVLMNEKLSKYEVHYGLFDHTERLIFCPVIAVILSTTSRKDQRSRAILGFQL
uniref:IRK_C domain-containing protein n=1 Tax=Angiostrongylus cantonensis TaxID=6313 RepID=A0A158PCK5_ANGCA